MNKVGAGIIFVGIVLVVGVFLRPEQLPSENVSATVSGIAIDVSTQTAPSSLEEEVETAQEVPEATNQLLATGTTSFSGSSKDRIANISVGVASIDGYVIRPGEEFSTVAALGEITEEKGYKEEKVFRDGAVASGLGGGLCQVSTTLFQAVLAAGLPVTERANHTFTVPYYPKGLDATIAGPHPDFRFVNDTAHDIVIVGTTKDGKVTFELHGKADGRKSVVSEVAILEETPAELPQIFPVDFFPPGEQTCIGTSHDGLKTSVDYTITYADGSEKMKTFFSTYRSMTPVCYVGASR